MKDKQIEEMAKDIYMNTSLSVVEIAEEIAEYLTAKDYRKASDVAVEVINKAMSKIQIMISSIKQHEQTNIITEFNGGAKTALEIVFKDLAELKKKYTKEE